MRRTLSMLVATALVSAACGGSDAAAPTDAPLTDASLAEAPVTNPPATEAPATEPPATDLQQESELREPAIAFSDDGDLGMLVPDGSGTTVSLLDPSEWPAELAGVEAAPGVKIYDLGPDGATFDEPVTVSRRLDISSFDALELGPHDVPLVTMLTQNGAGEYELLDDLTIMRLGSSVFVSGTTTHFSPITVANENRMIPWLPGENEIDPFDIPDPTTLLDDDAFDPIAALLSMDDVGPGAPDGPLWQDSPFGEIVEGSDLVDVVRRIVEEGIAPDEGGTYWLPDEAGEPLPSAPVPPSAPTPDDASSRAQRFGQSFPSIPISLAPSAQALLDNPEQLFDLTVRSLELRLSDAEILEVQNKIADELGDAIFGVSRIQFIYEVFHEVFGDYPSNIFATLADLVVKATQSAYVFSWQGGPPTRDTRIVDIREAVMSDEGLRANLGVECFCDYNLAVLVLDEPLAPELLDVRNAPMFWDLIAANPDSARALGDPSSGEILDLTVSSDGGTTFDGEAELLSILRN